MLSDLIRPAMEQMVTHVEGEFKAALDAALPGWTLLDVKNRCRLVSIKGLPFETLFLDDKPLLELGPIEYSQTIEGDAFKIRYTRSIRRLATGPTDPNT